jgi:SUKH-4 immunity protein
MNVEYPRFETQVFAASPEVAALFADLPAARHALFEEGIPKELFGGGYSADVDLTVHEWDGRAPIVRFGSSGLMEMLGIDLSNGHVIKVIDVPAKPMLLVNTTVDQFTLTVRAVTERFPYYAKTAEYEEMDRIAEELREIVRSIDEKAAVPGCYWPAFIDDVQDGNFATEDILAWQMGQS